jgi:hypothetical protein
MHGNPPEADHASRGDDPTKIQAAHVALRQSPDTEGPRLASAGQTGTCTTRKLAPANGRYARASSVFLVETWDDSADVGPHGQLGNLH